jgi:predicted nucleic acid-binding protein
VCRDPDDDLVLGLVRRVRPEFVVTGDRDLLVLREFDGSRIVSPREFMSLADRLLGEEE